MTCTSPLRGWRPTAGGRLVFQKDCRLDLGAEVEVPCGQCMGCRVDRTAERAIQVMHESKMWRHNGFVTLTLDDVHLPEDQSVDRRTVQLWLKRLRKAHTGQTIRYEGCAEYGENGTQRPHYHAVLFNWWPRDAYYWRKNEHGDPLYRSASLEAQWGQGRCEFGEVTTQSARYVTGYIRKKLTGGAAQAAYRRIDAAGHVWHVEAPFGFRSTHPGIGAEWFKKFRADVFPWDAVTLKGGFQMKVPRYYNRLLEKADPQLLEELKWQREQAMREMAADRTPERLAVRAEVLEARLRTQRRDRV